MDLGKRSVAVNIAGQRFVVRSEADETYVRTLAEFLVDRIEEVRTTQRVVSTQNLAILAALNIADELFREQTRHARLKQRIRDKSKALLAYLEREERQRSRDG